MGVIIVAIVIAITIFIIVKKTFAQVECKNATSSNANAVSENCSNDFAYGRSWSKPSTNSLWDSLDYFVHLAEVQSGHIHCDLTSVNLVLHVEDKCNHKKGDFVISYFDFERVPNEIPYLNDVKDFCGCKSGFKGFDPQTTALNLSLEKIHELVMEEAPHAQMTHVSRGLGDGTLCISFSFPARG